MHATTRFLMAASSFAFSCIATTAGAADCIVDLAKVKRGDNRITNAAKANFTCIVNELNKLKRRVSTLEKSVSVGAVIPFHRDAGCPEGWTDMGSVWRGKALVAAVKDSNQYGPGQTGGSATHKIELSDLPKLNDVLHRASGGVDYILTTKNKNLENPKILYSETNFGKPAAERRHNNMPPYIALYFCKKNKEKK